MEQNERRQHDPTVTQLLEAYARMGHLAAKDRRKALQLYLAYCLRDETRDGILQRIQVIYAQLSSGEKPPVRKAVVQDLTPMITTLKAYYGEETAYAQGDTQSLMAQVETAFNEIAETLRSVLGRGSLAGQPMRETVKAAAFRIKEQERALESSAGESFDRILGALDPQTVEGSVGGAKVKIGPFHKAALYDAMVEKYGQIKAYHEKGRLVRDFRAAYKSNFKKMQNG